LGAVPVTSPEDVLYALHIDPEERTTKTGTAQMPDDVRAVLDLLTEPKDRDTLMRLMSLPETDILPLLMKMELDGLIKEQNGVIYRIN
jgi:predicted Rossmann fold nucleotide-binding protein DprA/Smf involved in DNA uptake